jgi:hypothetical protein
MRGDDLLLLHLALLDEPAEPSVDRPPPRERLEDELGEELAEHLLASLTR